MFGKLTRTLRGSQVDIYSDGGGGGGSSTPTNGHSGHHIGHGGMYPGVERRTQSVVNVKQRKHRHNRLGGMGRLFGSDCEEEVTSVVSDIPGLYGRSCSMNTLTDKKTMKKKTSEGKLERLKHAMCESSSRNPLKLNIEMKLKILNFERERKLRILTDKRKKLSRIKSNENIDACISAAELEFTIEREQVEVMGISQEIQQLQTALERESRIHTDTLFTLTNKFPGISLQSRELRSKEGIVLNGDQLIIAQDMFNLKEGDIVLELNGESMLSIQTEEDWLQVKDRVNLPWRLVAARPGPGHDNTGCGEGGHSVSNEEGAEMKGLQQDIALIQSRLEEKLKEGRDVSTVLGMVSKEKENLERENTRLNHRIFYLEEQVNDLQRSLRQVRDSLSRTLNTEIQDTLHKLDTLGLQNLVYQRGSHMASIEVPLDTVSSSSGVYSGAGSEGSNSPDSHHVARLLVNQDKARERRRGGDRSLDVTRRSDLADTRRSEVGERTLDTRRGGGGGLERANSRVATLSNLVKLPFSRGPQTQNTIVGNLQ